MLQTNPIHQSQHGVLHSDAAESFKALLVYSRHHKWLPEDGRLQLDLFLLYSIFLFLNEVLEFLCFWGFCFLFGLDDAVRVSAACFRICMGAFSCCCGGVPTMAIMLPLYFFKPQQEQTGQPRKILSFYSIAQRQKTKPGKMSVKMTFLPRYKCSHTVQPAAPSAVLVLHTLSTQNGGGGETSFFFLSFFISCHP